MIVAKWSVKGLFKADAQRVADEISSIGETATPQQVLDKAKDESTELHKCFTWDNSAAAEKWRLHEARNVICHLVIDKIDDAPKEEPVRVFFKPETTSGYKRVDLIIKDGEYEALLKQAKAELVVFKTKYKRLTELENVFEAIDEII